VSFEAVYGMKKHDKHGGSWALWFVFLTHGLLRVWIDGLCLSQGEQKNTGLDGQT